MAIEKEAPEEVGAVIKHNLSESAIFDQTLKSLSITIPAEAVLTYTEHKGSHKIRSLVSQAANDTLTPEDVLVTAGASTSLFIIKTSLLGPKDHLVVTCPNYATNLEILRSIGCDITFIYLKFESQFRLDIDRISAAIHPSITRLISICSPNNPTSTQHNVHCLQAPNPRISGQRKWVLPSHQRNILRPQLRLSHGNGENAIPVGASLSHHVITVFSMSKAYSIPRIRVGWLTTTNPLLQESFLAAKEQISISGSVLDDLIAEQILSRRTKLLPKTIPDMRHRRDHVAIWVDEESELLDWVRPEAGVMCFIRMRKEPAGGTEEFYRRLLKEHGVYVGRGTWFEMDDTFFRLGYWWPTWEELKTGLDAISKAFRG